MSVKVENLTNSLVLLRLNSGTTLHLPPKAVVDDLLDVEVENNTKMQKLLSRNTIALHKKPAVQKRTTGSRKAKTKAKNN